MRKYAIIGHPVVQSKSPIIHPMIADFEGRKLDYDLLDVKNPLDLKHLMHLLRINTFHGYNVTVPYKEIVMSYLDELSPKAREIGAVNTVCMKDGKLYGDNTDYDGFIELFNSVPKKDNSRIIILGSGGAAKAVFLALKEMKHEPIVISRTKHHDEHFSRVLTYDELSTIEYDIIINCTPVGMFPNTEQSPLGESFVKDKIVIDLIYKPVVTKLMSYAKQAYNGTKMLVYQAIKAQSLWEGYPIHLSSEQIEEISEVVNRE